MSYLPRMSGFLDAVGLREPKVLVVDDDRGVVEMNREWLESAGFDVIVATDGRSALKKVDGDVDVVLLDRRMPGLSGDQVAEVLRSEDVQGMPPEEFGGPIPFFGLTPDVWDRDLSLDTAKDLDPEVVRSVQRDDIELQICMVTAVEPDLDILNLEFDHYLVKDGGREELVETVKHLAKLSRLDGTQRRYQRLRCKRNLLERTFTEQELMQDDRYKELLEVMEGIEIQAGRKVEQIKQVPFQ